MSELASTGEIPVALRTRPRERFDPFSAEFRSDPHAVYRRFLRSDPVHWGAPPIPRLDGSWYVFRYADVTAALKDPRLVREPQRVSGHSSLPPAPEPIRPYCEMVRRWMLFRDPPEHERLRSLLGLIFTPRRVQDLEPQIDALARELLERLPAHGEVDLMEAFALPLPVIVISRLLGLPLGDRDRLRGWSRTLVEAIDLRQDDGGLEAAGRTAVELEEYLRPIVRERRQRPRADAISALAELWDRGLMDEDEVVANCALLIFAGHETTVNLLGSGVLALLGHPQELAKLRERPELWPGAVEEILRFDGPIQLTFRFAGEDLRLGDRDVRRGQSVALVLASANRDPAAFPDPDRLDVERCGARHLGLGLGIHFCLGAALARAEARIA
ncbi:MAG TPA: cytochrome P450, partial [Planctomycetota bacterium]|nr:cytochrome P450 [Planctomycetota bacterium]